MIAKSLRRIAETLDFDRAILWRKLCGEAVAYPAYYWQRTPNAIAPSPLPTSTVPYLISRLAGGAADWFPTIDDVPAPVDRETFRARGVRTAVWVPVPLPEVAEGTLCVLDLSSTTREHEVVPEVLERLRLIAGEIGHALAHRTTTAKLRQALEELQKLGNGSRSELLERRRRSKRKPPMLVAESVVMKPVLTQAEQVAPTPATVLLLGETGTGKEVLAETIHQLSPRRLRPMVRINCAAMPATLIESELFGREPGAFTGAVTGQIGRFEAANHSTVFLDEIGELPLEIQVKLLRVLQDRVIERLGSVESISVDVRIIAATNRNLEEAVRGKAFREDLFYRLNVFPITVPPLRERRKDIPSLVSRFIDEFSRLYGKTIQSVPKDSMRRLQQYAWPGNVRELRNVIERAVILTGGRVLEVSVPSRVEPKLSVGPMVLANVQTVHIRAVLDSTNWRVGGPGGAAERLGVKPTTLENRMARLGIERKSRL
jgi:transcriptional regulator with GAF, ATPase, and Fis domain